MRLHCTGAKDGHLICRYENLSISRFADHETHFWTHALGAQVPDSALEEGRLSHGDRHVPGEHGDAAGVAGEVEVLLGEVGLHPELRSHWEPDDGRHGSRVGRWAPVGQDGEEHCIVKEECK